MQSHAMLPVHWGYFIDGTRAMHSSQSSGSPTLPPHRASGVDIIDMLA
jgi:hypothetical protein